MLGPVQPGPHDAITDVAGVRVGHSTRDEPGWLTGVTVVVPPPGTVGGVDVRGGGPGTRETDLLDPRNLVSAVDAVVLAGGSAFGLAAADGVAAAVYEHGAGWPVGPEPHERVPIVPAAILSTSGRGGSWLHHPGAAGAAAAARGLAAPTGGNGGAGSAGRSTRRRTSASGRAPDPLRPRRAGSGCTTRGPPRRLRLPVGRRRAGGGGLGRRRHRGAHRRAARWGGHGIRGARLGRDGGGAGRRQRGRRGVRRRRCGCSRPPGGGRGPAGTGSRAGRPPTGRRWRRRPSGCGPAPRRPWPSWRPT